jgi:threonine aldolase
MRFISAHWVGLLDNNTRLCNAGHANAMTQRIYAGMLQVKGVQVLHAPEANGVVAQLRKTLTTPCMPRAGSSTNSLPVVDAASCALGTRTKPRSTPC